MKEDLTAAALVAHPQQDAFTRFMVNKSDGGVGAVLQQFVGETWQLLAFFSKSLAPAEIRYSTYGRELLAVHTAVKYFRQVVWTSHVSAAGSSFQMPEAKQKLNL